MIGGMVNRLYKIWLLLLVALVFVAGGWFLATAEIDNRRADLLASRELAVNLTAERISGFLNEPALLLRAFRTERQVVDSLEHLETHFSVLESALFNLARREPSYDQVRWIDEQGMEQIRIQRLMGQPIRVADHLLQDKSGRYYFQDAMKLDADGVYFSPLDLNVERGKIEQPYRPTVRVAVPAENSRGQRKGIFIINRDADALFGMIHSAVGQDRLLLANASGDWLRGMRPEQDWGFMFGRTDGLAETYPKVWAEIRDRDSGQIANADGVWIWSTVSPFETVLRGTEAEYPAEARYKLLSFISQPTLAAISRDVWATLLPFMALGALAFWALLVRLIDTRERARETAARLAESERLRKVEERADEAETQALALVESNVNGMLTVDVRGHIMMTNPALNQMFGYEEGELLGQPLEILVPHDIRSGHKRDRTQFLKKPRQQRMRQGLPVWGRCKNGEQIPLEVSLSPVKAHSGVKVTATVIDIRNRMEAESQLRQMASVFENTGDGIVITDDESRILNVNHAFVEITGYSAQEVLGKTPQFYHSGRHTSEFYRDMERKIHETGHWRGEHTGRRKDGTIYSEWLTVSRVTNEAGEITNYVHVFADISRIKDSEEQLDRLTHHNTLTDLPNRRLFMQRLEHALVQANRRGKSLAVIILDLDNFKHINDGLGHDVGDQLLQQVAAILTDALRQDDTVARLGGDEFGLMLEDMASTENAESLAIKLIERLDAPLTISQHEVRVTSSMGICFYPQDGQDSVTLLKNADAAMYRAKEDGRNRYQFYTEALTTRSVERLNLETSLRQSLERGDFYLVYQAQVELRTGRLTGVEALIRWNHPEMGLISPARFIPLAEESGLILQLEQWVFHQACTQARDWLDRGINFGRMAINLSGKSINAGNVPKIISQTLLETHCPAECIELEVSEGFIMQRAMAAIEQLNELREMGIALAIDDFGTGYSSLAYLKQLPVDKLKIDQAFVRDVTTDPNDRAIVSAVIAMGHKLNLLVIAEGVETREQAKFLIEEGCQEAQGYLYSKPIVPEEFEAFQSKIVQVADDSRVILFPRTNGDSHRP